MQNAGRPGPLVQVVYVLGDDTHPIPLGRALLAVGPDADGAGYPGHSGGPGSLPASELGADSGGGPRHHSASRSIGSGRAGDPATVVSRTIRPGDVRHRGSNHLGHVFL